LAEVGRYSRGRCYSCCYSRYMLEPPAGARKSERFTIATSPRTGPETSGQNTSRAVAAPRRVGCVPARCRGDRSVCSVYNTRVYYIRVSQRKLSCGKRGEERLCFLASTAWARAALLSYDSAPDFTIIFCYGRDAKHGIQPHIRQAVKLCNIPVAKLRSCNITSTWNAYKCSMSPELRESFHFRRLPLC